MPDHSTPQAVRRTDRGAALAVLFAATACTTPPSDEVRLPLPATEWNPRTHVCYRAPSAPDIDGRLDDAAWGAAPWSDTFVDISGPGHPEPDWPTRMKLLWDDQALYIGAWLDEPHVWGKLTERDAVIYYDNDFEVFIDPDGDTHDYYELEVNALGTEWDLLLKAPYRDGDGVAVDAWDIAGLETGVSIDGTLNDASDTDRGWSVEIAIPWPVLAEYTDVPSPPRPGDRWWMNFSRVEWQTEVVEGEYVKRTDAATGKPLAEDNWVWSPQGLVAMHYPEMWGMVQFSALAAGEGVEAFVADPTGPARWALRKLYYAQKHHAFDHGAWALDIADLDLSVIDAASTAPFAWPPRLEGGAAGWEATTSDPAGNTLAIRHDGRLRQTAADAP